MSINYKKEQKMVKTPVSLTCDVCKKTISLSDNYEDSMIEFIKIDFVGGYFSPFGDMHRVEGDICHDCLKEHLGQYLRISNTLEDIEGGGLEEDISQYLNPVCFIINVFAAYKNLKGMSFETLRQVLDYVESKLNITFEWTKDFVLSELKFYTYLFKVNDNWIEWQESYDREVFKEDCNAQLPEDFVRDLENAIDAIDEFRYI
jgi:hypothetical protein